MRSPGAVRLESRVTDMRPRTPPQAGGRNFPDAWQVRYADAIATAEAIPIGGVRVPFLSLEMLI